MSENTTGPKKGQTMNTVTRHSVFETNSSSSHSISIVGGNYRPDKIPLEDGICRVYGGEFGWGIDQYNDAATKASYCLVYAFGDTWNDGDGDRAPVYPEKLETLRAVIAKQTGAEVVFDMSGYNYIDHQSRENDDWRKATAETAFASEQALRDFIFNPASELLIDNDNH